NVMPAAIGGKWYIYYKGSYPWSHFEVPAAKSATVATSANIEIYPNPFTDAISIQFNGHRVYKIEIYSPVGQLFDILKDDDIGDNLVRIFLSYPGNIFMIKITSDAGTTNHIVFRR
ncbi:MAG: hypothetical protein WHT29_12535, partial [Bacteroidales bacterium]